MIKEKDPRILLQNSEEKKNSLSTELERENEKLQKALVIMSINEQNERKMLAYENERLTGKNEKASEKITGKNEDELERKK